MSERTLTQYGPAYRHQADPFLLPGATVSQCNFEPAVREDSSMILHKRIPDRSAHRLHCRIEIAVGIYSTLNLAGLHRQGIYKGAVGKISLPASTSVLTSAPNEIRSVSPSLT